MIVPGCQSHTSSLSAERYSANCNSYQKNYPQLEKECLKLIINIALLESETSRVRVLEHLYQLLNTIASDSLITKEDIASEIITLIAEIDLVIPQTLFSDDAEEFIIKGGFKNHQKL